MRQGDAGAGGRRPWRCTRLGLRLWCADFNAKNREQEEGRVMREEEALGVWEFGPYTAPSGASVPSYVHVSTNVVVHVPSTSKWRCWYWRWRSCAVTYNPQARITALIGQVDQYWLQNLERASRVVAGSDIPHLHAFALQLAHGSRIPAASGVER